MVDIFCTCYQHLHTDRKGRLCHFPLSLTPGVRHYHYSTGLRTLTWPCPYAFTQDFTHSRFPLFHTELHCSSSSWL